jgi:DnaJ-domain-containing protein 1
MGLGPLGSLVFSVLGLYVEVRIRAERRRAGAGRRRRAAPDPAGPDAELARACRVLGVRPGASLSEARRAYRELAKSCHPDLLRARGASEREVAEATERMARVNAAWRIVSGRM